MNDPLANVKLLYLLFHLADIVPCTFYFIKKINCKREIHLVFCVVQIEGGHIISIIV